MVSEFKRFKYIDSLRGIAILLVVISHSRPYFAGITNYKLPGSLDEILQNGDKGVTLFFLMSAFTLCLSLNSKKDTEQHPIRNYFIRRGFRIAPMYYFIIIVILLLHINSPSAPSVFSNLLFLHGANPYWINSTVPGGWSVGIEVMFYLIFPFLFFKIKSIYSAINVTLVFILVSKIVTGLMFKNPAISNGILWGVYVYENIISQLPVFLIGICLFHLHNIKTELIDKQQLYKCCFYIAILIIFHLLGGNIFKEHYLYAIAFMLAAFGLSRYQPALLLNKFTEWVGRLSYSIYLIHLVVASLLVKYHLATYSSNMVFEVFYRFVILFSISAVLSYLTYIAIEVPFQSYGKRLINRLEAKNKLALPN